jgi:putative CocE/NonD family hydrolase
MAERGYHVVVQNIRGRFNSEGVFEPFTNEAADGKATLDWIGRQPWFNGSAGMWGQSYLGYVQWAVAGEAPPYLKALMPAVTSSEFYTLTYPDGSLNLDTMLRWTYLVNILGVPGKKPSLALVRQTSPAKMEAALRPAFLHLPVIEADKVALDRPVPFYRKWLEQPSSGDSYWKATDHSDGVAKTTAATYFLSGWYDILLRELLADYARLKAAGKTPYLTIGPWFHLNLSYILECVREGLVWYDVHLKGESKQIRQHPVKIMVMGANQWRELEDWPPPAQEQRYFLHARRVLSTDTPEAESEPDPYRYDPADPTPVVGGPLFNPLGGSHDNRPTEARADVLTYTSPPLDDDLEIIGTGKVELYVRSSLEYTDFFIRLCDVYPDGRSMNICDGFYRVTPGQGEPQSDGSLKLQIELWPTANRFLKGHRLRLQVSSGAHPRWNRNTGSGEPLATATTLIVAEQSVYHDDAHPSALFLPVTSD